MTKIASTKRIRNRRSNVGAVGGGTRTAPGERATGSPHGSGARPSFVSMVPPLDELSGRNRWRVVRVDAVGSLPMDNVTTLVICVDYADAVAEACNWGEGLGLPVWLDGGPHATLDPAAGWPL